ncbi:MAG: efflux RND transporter permease subunit [Chloroflexi bacterium]|nr:efflux RND transporter permease subunit [Chloroflexota bacterium]
MRAFFTWLTRMSLRFRGLTLALAVLVGGLGVFAITRFQIELIPSIEFPQTVVLGQVSGMTSDEVLQLITEPLERQFMEVDGVVNVETTTTGAFGAIFIVRNEFGLNQARIQDDIRAVLDSQWLPLRRIQPGPDQDAATLLADLTPETLIYLHETDPNFLFQLTPDVWRTLPAATVEPVLVYLAGQTEATSVEQSPLRRLVDVEILPQLESLAVVADVTVSGGQRLPGEDAERLEPVAAEPAIVAQSLLLELSPEVWAIVAQTVGGLGAQDEATVAALRASSVEIPTAAPELPASWQMDRFVDASDLAEMRTATRTVAGVLNQFYEDGQIVGPLGQTDDLTPEIITQMTEVAPTMLDYFEPEHLAAFSDEVFAALPAEYVATLDGFARDELAAAALAASITGEEANGDPITLPNAWRIAQPAVITFSFDDLPLATFSVFGTGEAVAIAQGGESAPEAGTAGTAANGAQPPAATAVPNPQTVPEGPALPQLFGLIGEQIGLEIDSADDLLTLTLPGEFAELTGAESLSAAEFFNFLTLLADPTALAAAGAGETGGDAAAFDPAAFDFTTALPALNECGVGALGLFGGDINFAEILIGCVDAEIIAYLNSSDPEFLSALQPDVYEYFPDEVLALAAVAPPLPDVWDTLADQPQFSAQPLQTAGDLLALGDGQASLVLNTLNAAVPEQFAGYEVRLIDSLTPAVTRYLALQEDGFYLNLDAEVLAKFSPTTLSGLPETVLADLDADLAADLTAIANGELPSAVDDLASLYASDVAPADPNAPEINPEWGTLGGFFNIELDSADDFFRFPADFQFADAAALINSLFRSAQGASFAPSVLGNLPVEAAAYMLDRDAAVFDDLRAEALQELSDDVLALLSPTLQARAASGGEPFVPTTTVTRTNGQSSLQLTVFATSGANAVAAFHEVEDFLEALSAENGAFEIAVVQEQASFIEESIDGVAREGGLGGVFAITMILIFLSGGVWTGPTRRTAGIVLVVIGGAGLALLTGLNLNSAAGDVGAAFAMIDIIFSVPLLLLLVAGLIFLLWPRRVPVPAWRSTLVTAVSIPLSLLTAFALMQWLPGTVHNALLPAADNGLVAFLLRLFPEDITLNIMTLSGLTVAIGRIVDDSIVVLENIFRQLQEGGDRRAAIIKGTRDVSIAIFAATLITVIVFLPLGLTGGIIGEFFLPFGLAVSYSLLSSFFIAITVVPVMTYLIVRAEDVHEAGEGRLERTYLPALRWALASNRNRGIVLFGAFASVILAGALFGARPAAFLPDFGEPQILTDVNLPGGTPILETNALVADFEQRISTTLPADEVVAVQTLVGSGGISLESFLGAGGSVSENQASVTIGLEGGAPLDTYAQLVRAEAESIFGTDNVSVSAASAATQGFGSFALVLAGPQAVLEDFDARVIETLNGVEGLTNASSTLSQIGGAGGTGGPVTYLRVDGQTAVSYTGEVEGEDTINIIQRGITAVEAIPGLPDSVTVSQGFEAEIQTQGFASLFVAMGIAIVIVVIILVFTFGSLVHWLAIIFSIVVAPVGAAVALTLTDRVLGISALIGLLMLIGIVVTNAVVLTDRVMQNRRERNMTAREALIEAGGRRLRPILMTALATIFALMPLAVGSSSGAIIAAELGTVVIGGLFSSTLLTLLVVPVAYSLLDPLDQRIGRLFGRRRQQPTAPGSSEQPASEVSGD